jgi:hypothetical protein
MSSQRPALAAVGERPTFAAVLALLPPPLLLLLFLRASISQLAMLARRHERTETGKREKKAARPNEAKRSPPARPCVCLFIFFPADRAAGADEHTQGSSAAEAAKWHTYTGASSGGNLGTEPAAADRPLPLARVGCRGSAAAAATPSSWRITNGRDNKSRESTQVARSLGKTGLQPLVAAYAVDYLPGSGRDSGAEQTR